MSTYRTQVKIVADVLSCISDGNAGEQGLGITRILQKANLSYSRATNILNRLICVEGSHPLHHLPYEHNGNCTF